MKYEVRHIYAIEDFQKLWPLAGKGLVNLYLHNFSNFVHPRIVPSTYHTTLFSQYCRTTAIGNDLHETLTLTYNLLRLPYDCRYYHFKWMCTSSTNTKPYEREKPPKEVLLTSDKGSHSVSQSDGPSLSL